jgi:hypothetical protein
MRNKIVGATVVAGLAVSGLAACGSTTTARTASAPVSVQGALRATPNQSGLRLTVTVNGDPATFTGGRLTAAQKQAILASSLVLTIHAGDGRTLANADTGGQAALALENGGSQLAQLEEVGSTAYAKVDISKIASVYHLDPQDVARFRALLGRYSSQVSALRALEQGRWISLDLGAIQPLAQAAGMTLPSIPQLAAGLTTTVFNVLAEGATPATAGSGPSQVTVDVHRLITALAHALTATSGLAKLSPQIGDLAQKAEQAVPSNTFAKVDVTVIGGTVSNLRIPLNQFDTARHLNSQASVNVAVAPANTVAAPSGAVPVNLGQLLGLIGQSMGSHWSGGGSTSAAMSALGIAG